MPAAHKFLVVAAAALTLVVFPAAASATTKLSSSESALLKEINRVRSTHGLNGLAFDPSLARAARAHTRAMGAAGAFAHGDFSSRMSQFHVQGLRLGENLAWGSGEYGTPRGIVNSWLASPAHRANLLRPGFRRVGLGAIQTRFRGADGASVVTADFAGA